MSIRDKKEFDFLLQFVVKGFRWHESRLGAKYWQDVRTRLLRIGGLAECYGSPPARPNLASFASAKTALLRAFDWKNTSVAESYWARVHDALAEEYLHFLEKIVNTAPEKAGVADPRADKPILGKLIAFIAHGFDWGRSKYGSEYWSPVLTKLYQVENVVPAVYEGLARPPVKRDFLAARDLLSRAFIWSDAGPGRHYWATVSDRLLQEATHVEAVGAAPTAGLSPPGGHLKPVVDDPVNDGEDRTRATVLLAEIIESDTGLKDVQELSEIAAILNFRVARLIRDEQAPTRPEHDTKETFQKRLVSVFSALAIYAEAVGVDLVDTIVEDAQS